MAVRPATDALQAPTTGSARVTTPAPGCL